MHLIELMSVRECVSKAPLYTHCEFKELFILCVLKVFAKVIARAMAH